ncbi:MAG: glutathione S-transferase [Arenimonas sp.]
MSPLPLLYSFRRCPYAIRARLAIASSGVVVEPSEVDLKAKPARMLQLSPKGTVPVLVLTDGSVIEESLDIMLWALQQHDPLGLLDGFSDDAKALIRRNDGEFKSALDRYKYPERYPEYSMQHYRAHGEIFLSELNTRLEKQDYLFGDKPGMTDLALMPFIRQFAQVDRGWFDTSAYLFLRKWLVTWEASDLFIKVMQKS